MGLKSLIERALPYRAYLALVSPYHYARTFLAALLAGFPARRMVVIGINGTKGKSTVADMLFSILRAAGKRTALVSTIRFAVDNDSKPNRFKMTMPGHGFIQEFLGKARKSGATHAIVELTTEGARQHRHAFLFLDMLLMLNVQKEHIESHGSFEKYVAAKWEIAKALERSVKPHRAIITCTDDAENARFLDARVPTRMPFSLAELREVESDEHSVSFSYSGVRFTVPLPGVFNAVNALGAVKAAEHLGIPLEVSARALSSLPPVRGRVERIECGQDFAAVVDYAHTPDSLAALYGAFPNVRKICVLGNTGGGRDAWKRPEMGRIADQSCDEVILTDEDPYDEDPQRIVDAMATGMKRAPSIIMDRREAIREALTRARPGDAVLISGKGTDPFIMRANGERVPWSDADVVREELGKLLEKRVS